MPAPRPSSTKGSEVGLLAQGLFHDGIDLAQMASVLAQQALQSRRPLFEASFVMDRASARVDMLVPVMASQEFLRVTFGEVTDAERQRVRRQLEQYCGRDTEGWSGLSRCCATRCSDQLSLKPACLRQTRKFLHKAVENLISLPLIPYLSTAMPNRWRAGNFVSDSRPPNRLTGSTNVLFGVEEDKAEWNMSWPMPV